MHKTNLNIAGAFVVGFIAATGAWQSLNFANASNQETYRYLNLFGDVFDRVRADYVEEPDSEKLIDTARRSWRRWLGRCWFLGCDSWFWRLRYRPAGPG